MSVLIEQQIALSHTKLYRGQIDGINGPGTKMGLDGYAAANGGVVGLTAGFELQSWMTKAFSYLGLCEVPGRENAKKILDWWRLIDAPWFKNDETPWCAGFVGGILEECGIDSSKSARARSYENWGRHLFGPTSGAIVVLSRGKNPAKGHVGFLVGVNMHGHPVVLGGNQGNRVSVTVFDKSRVVEYRYPKGMEIPQDATLPILSGAAYQRGFSRNEA